MRRLLHTAVAAALALGLSGCFRFGTGDETWADLTQDRFADLLVDAEPFPAVAWPTGIDSPYERAMAHIALGATETPSSVDGAVFRDSFEESWDGTVGGFTQEGVPSLNVSEVVWRALTMDGREPYEGPGSEARLVDLAADALGRAAEPLDIWESLAAVHLLSLVAEHGEHDEDRDRAAGHLRSFDVVPACEALYDSGASPSEVAAMAAIAGYLDRECPRYPLERAEVDRGLRDLLAETAPDGRRDAGALAVFSEASHLSEVGMADPALVEQGVDSMLSLAADDGFEPDPRFALEVADLAARNGREAAFGPRMQQMLRATVWSAGAIPDDAVPDAASFLALADTLDLLPGGPDREDLAVRVDWDSRGWNPYDRLVATIAADPSRAVAADLDVLAGLQTDLASAPLAWRASLAIGGCPSQVRSYTAHHLGLLRGADPGVLVEETLPLHLRDLSALIALGNRCKVDGHVAADELRAAIETRLDEYRVSGGLYSLTGSEPDLEVTAVSIEALCHLGGDPDVPIGALRRLVHDQENAAGGTDARGGGTSLYATLAAAESLAYADGGCGSLLEG